MVGCDGVADLARVLVEPERGAEAQAQQADGLARGAENDRVVVGRHPIARGIGGRGLAEAERDDSVGEEAGVGGGRPLMTAEHA